jgi:hypothetical protein
MINANELRLGNIVERRREPGVVISLDREDLWVQFGGEWGDKERWYYDDIEGVNLMPEILEKCGFEKRLEYWEPFVGDAKGAWYKRGGILIVVLKSIGKIYRAIAINGDEFGYVNGPELTSLHQLQNLYFALTDEELEVKP